MGYNESVFKEALDLIGPTIASGVIKGIDDPISHNMVVFSETNHDYDHYPPQWDRFKEKVELAQRTRIQNPGDALVELDELQNQVDQETQTTLDEISKLGFVRVSMRLEMEQAITYRMLHDIKSSRLAFEKVIQFAIEKKDMSLLAEVTRHWVNLDLDMELYNLALIRSFYSVAIAKDLDRGDGDWFVKGVVLSIRRNKNLLSIEKAELLYRVLRDNYMRRGFVELISSPLKKRKQR